jgi:hypothetical protein
MQHCGNMCQKTTTLTKSIALAKYENNKLVFIWGRHLQPSIMFVGMARSLLKSGAPERCTTQVGSRLTQKY